VGGLNVAQGVVTAGAWFLFLQSLDRFFFPVLNLSAFWAQVQQGLSACERIFALIDAEHQVVQTAHNVVPPLRGDIRIEHLWFHYGETEPVLCDFNLHIRPGETVESVAQRVREIIDDPRVHVTVPEFSQNPSRVSDPESGAYRLLDRTIRETVPVEDLIVIPYLLTGGTDAKYYAARSTNVLRFLAVVMEAGDLERVHGTNERVRVESLASAVQFFHQLILNAEEL